MAEKVIDRIKYSKDSRLECLFEMSKSNKKIYVYGANRAASVRIKLLREYKINLSGCVVDSKYYKEGMTCEGLEVYKLDDISFDEAQLYIGFEDILRAREVVKEYAKKGIVVYNVEDPLRFKDMSFDFFLKNVERYQNAYDLLEDELSRDIFVSAVNDRISGNSENLAKYRSESEYDYDFKLLNLGGSEVFVDCGAYDGDTILNFCKETNNEYAMIYAFEADEKNAEKIEEKNIKNLKVIRKVVGDSSGKVKFYNDGSMFSNVVDSDIWGEETRRDLYEDTDAYVEVESCKIDDELIDERITLLKMDIEGSELSALEGAKKMIEKNYPNMAICVYHKPEDMFTLIELIHNCEKGKNVYKYYLRHHSSDLSETVLYAIKK